ncbi:MAG TPA: hypothetical protein VK509_24110 [Polyangiales bacterium]|nr:hypothetical protein [Polyangiales bacterium]
MKTGHELDKLQEQVRARQSQFDDDNRRQLAMDIGMQNAEAIGALKAENQGIRDELKEMARDVKGVLGKLGELTAVAPGDRWLHRIALLAVAAGGFSAFAWIAYQAWS